LDSFAVGITQLAHAVDECIFCREGWRHGSYQITLGEDLLILTIYAVSTV